MKNVIIASSALLMTLGLASCNTMNNAAQYTSSTVSHGVRTGVGVVHHTGTAVVRGTGTVVGTGVGVVHGAGTAVTNTVGGVVGTGVGLVTGRHVSHNQIIYHNGHRYMLKNGRYVRVY